MLVIGCYKPPSTNSEHFLNELYNAMSFYSSTYESFFLLGDFNISRDNELLNDFCNSFSLSHLIKSPTCFKGSNPSSIDHIITNMPTRFMKSCTLETGISDHHKLIMSIFRSTFAKGNSKTFYYRCFKNFDDATFKETLTNRLANTELSFDNFIAIFSETFNNFAPLKKKYLRYNNNSFMNKSLRKAIMTRSKLKNKFNLNRTSPNFEKYKKQRNICVDLLRKSKANYYSNINVKNINDNKLFWKTIRPNFSNKCKTAKTIILVEGKNVIKDDTEIADTFNNYFTDHTETLQLKKRKYFINKEISCIVESFKDCESIRKIKEVHKIEENSFSFTLFTEEEVKDAIKNLPNNKATTFNDIPVKILKQFLEVYSKKLTDIFNDCLTTGMFPDILKEADVTPVYKKDDVNNKENYRPVSTLSNFSKVFERLISVKINSYMDGNFSRFLTGFHKKHNTQHALLNMIENWKENLNKG